MSQHITTTRTILIEEDDRLLNLVDQYPNVTFLVMVILADLTPCLVTVYNLVFPQSHVLQNLGLLIKILLSFPQPVT